MVAVAFDTYKMVKSLRDDAQLTGEQAEGIVGAMVEAMSGAELATKTDVTMAKSELKADIADVRAEIAAVKAELKADIADVRAEIAAVKAELKAEIAAVKAELKAEIADVKAELKAEIAAVESRLMMTFADLRSDIRDARIDTLKLILGVMTFNVGAILGAMYGLAKLLGH